MSTKPQKYCLDTNVLIEAWQKYYSPIFCPSYWDVLNKLGAEEIIFIPEIVFEEITRTDDELSSWLKESQIPIHAITENVNESLKSIYAKDPLHKYLVDNIKSRSLADPWVIAHALSSKATVVTKENKETAINTKRIKIPNVCDNMGVRWINDFDFIRELNLSFTCKLK
jgi:predicted nucleic acid-binding protein